MLGREAIHDAVLGSLAALNADRAPEHQIDVSDETLIMGEGSQIDSLDFVGFSADLEARLRVLTGSDLVDIAAHLWSDQDALRDARTLTDHLATLLSA